ncbi:class I SAM-dependent methyltransferase [Dyadobacter sediminis]|uniref:Class I SAM-dependent methyltransferase n=1 Tax=Dyadobacter sediminis TaxID=1493691 RepID=A0A5R9K871_9BACT|nr:class I SAM-dependent methyltransferase [Dyadobacter sediminis]TLU90073.1 class I SAM-dependent methyltransferase [Dyadobacter sediminis]GGC10432.1 hypothetical protein GCM10011325_41520 [Dyadobacter sediminis]
MLSNENPWSNIPLKDYEAHMAHPLVGQSEMLSRLMESALIKYKPVSLAILGIAGGNGLEHVHTTQTTHVYGVDISQVYLNECQNRYSSQIENLILIKHDLNSREVLPFKVNLILAGLIFEYIELENGLNQVDSCLYQSGSLIVTLQKNNGVTSVSNSGINSIKQVAGIFNLVDEGTFEKNILALGYIKTERSESFLPNGKSFVSLEFKKLI